MLAGAIDTISRSKTCRAVVEIHKISEFDRSIELLREIGFGVFDMDGLGVNRQHLVDSLAHSQTRHVIMARRFWFPVRIAYLANYQGKELMARRPTCGNLALAGSWKISRISQFLVDLGHDVAVFSRGSVVGNSGCFFRGFSAQLTPEMPVTVHYSSCWDASYFGATLGILLYWKMFSKCLNDPFTISF